MAGFNHCVFVDRVGIDPELRETNEGVSYCRFRLAVDRGKEEPMWLNVVAWRNLATQMEKYVKKGSLVLVLAGYRLTPMPISKTRSRPA